MLPSPQQDATAQALAGLPTAFVLCDASGRVTSANDSALRLLGLGLIGPSGVPLPSALWRAVNQAAESQPVAFTCHDCAAISQLEFTVYRHLPGQHLVLFRDLDEGHRRTEDFLLRHRLESTRALAAAVAAELADSVESIAYNADRLISSPPSADHEGSILRELSSSAGQLQHVVDTLMAYAKVGPEPSGEASVGDLVDRIRILSGLALGASGVETDIVCEAQDNAALGSSLILCTQAVFSLIISLLPQTPSGGVIQVFARIDSGIGAQPALAVTVSSASPGDSVGTLEACDTFALFVSREAALSAGGTLEEVWADTQRRFVVRLPLSHTGGER